MLVDNWCGRTGDSGVWIFGTVGGVESESGFSGLKDFQDELVLS